MIMLRPLPVLILCSALPRPCPSFVISNNNPNDALVRGRDRASGSARRPPSPPPLAASPSQEKTGRGIGWEWDGEVEEGAHDAEFGAWGDDDGEEDDGVFVPSAGFLSDANSVASPALAATAGAATAPFDPSKNAGAIHRLSGMDSEGGDGDYVMSEDDLMEMGGDPAFLDDDAWAKPPTGDGDFFWDGTVDEDAHND